MTRSAQSGDAILEVRELTQIFSGIRALDRVTFDLRAGELHGVIGPNGAGKTTLLDVVTGIHRPRQGQVLLKGTEITRWTSHRRARAGLSRSFQTVGLAPSLTVRDNVLATIEALDRVRTPWSRPGPDRRRREEADSLLHHFGLDALRDTRVTALPFGTSKLLELAKVFAGDPAVVLLDEPFAGISRGESVVRADLIGQWRQRTNAAVVIVEHDVPLLVGMCDRLTILDQGKVLVTGPPERVMRKEEVRMAYLGELVESAGGST